MRHALEAVHQELLLGVRGTAARFAHVQLHVLKVRARGAVLHQRRAARLGIDRELEILKLRLARAHAAAR